MVVPISTAIPLLILVLIVGSVPRQFPGVGSSRRSAAGPDEDKSCDVDVEDTLVPELDDNLGTKRGSKLFVLHLIFFNRVVNRGFPMPLHHFVNLLDPKKYLMSPAGRMWKTTLRLCLTTILVQQQARHFPSCMESFSHSWSDVASDHWPTHMNNRALRRVS